LDTLSIYGKGLQSRYLTHCFDISTASHFIFLSQSIQFKFYPNQVRAGKLFSVPAMLAFMVVPALSLLALTLYYSGATSLAKPVMSAVLFSSFVAMFAVAVVVLLARALWLLGAVEFSQVRRGPEQVVGMIWRKYSGNRRPAPKRGPRGACPEQRRNAHAWGIHTVPLMFPWKESEPVVDYCRFIIN
jgi:hypothetical protein